ncbi:hypothetical protein BH18ACT3_BH18ACT3_09600 [soil metagenome]
MRIRPQFGLWALAVLIVAAGGVVLSQIDKNHDTDPSIESDPSTMPTDATGGTSTTTPPSSTVAPETRNGWVRVPEPPLTPRNDAVAAWTGSEVIVFGGAEGTVECEGSGCGHLDLPASTDGAAYNPQTRTWRPIAPAPLAASRSPPPVMIGDDLYVIAEVHDYLDWTISGILRYRVSEDAWSVIPPPADELSLALNLANGGGQLVAYEYISYENPPRIWHWDDRASSWELMPTTDTGPRELRWMAWLNGHLHAFWQPAHADGDPASAMRVARLEAENETWEELPSGPPGASIGFVLGEQVFIEPPFSDETVNVIFDGRTERWTEIPDMPALPGRSNLFAGLIGRDTSVFNHPLGAAFDLDERRWVQIRDLYEDSTKDLGTFAAAGRGLFAYGGLQWRASEDPRLGKPINDAWMWQPPPP